MRLRALRSTAALAALAALAACASTPAPKPQAPRNPPKIPTTPLGASGLERVMGKNARTLQALFGPPDLDVREGGARKLQFVGPACVLDAYLYPPAAAAEPLVRYLDARLPNGDDFDRASCIAALSRRPEAR